MTDLEIVEKALERAISNYGASRPEVTDILEDIRRNIWYERTTRDENKTSG